MHCWVKMKGILIWKIRCGFKVLVSLTKEKLWEIIKGIKNKHIEQRQQRNLLGDGVGGRIPWESVTTANSDIGNTIWKYITFCLSRKNFSLISIVLSYCFFSFLVFSVFFQAKNCSTGDTWYKTQMVVFQSLIC